MLRLKQSTRFKKDLKRELRKPNRDTTIQSLTFVTELLQKQIVLPDRFHVHRLKGNYVGYFECHVRPDLLLIYVVIDEKVLELVRLGSHSELFK